MLVVKIELVFIGPLYILLDVIRWRTNKHNCYENTLLHSHIDFYTCWALLDSNVALSKARLLQNCCAFGTDGAWTGGTFCWSNATCHLERFPKDLFISQQVFQNDHVPWANFACDAEGFATNVPNMSRKAAETGWFFFRLTWKAYIQEQASNQRRLLYWAE